MNNQAFSKIWIVIVLVVFVAGGILVWQNWFRKISPEKLEEFAFLQNGDIWVAGKDFESKYKAIDTKEAITNFAISPDGKEIYWLNEKGEIWKKDDKGTVKPLVSIEKDMEEVIVEEGKVAVGPGEDLTLTSYLRGKVERFWLSRNGEYIVYTTLEEYERSHYEGWYIPVGWIWIMRGDGTAKVKIEKPLEEERDIINFNKWFPDSKRILFHFRGASEVIGGSPFYEVGVDGKNPKVYPVTGYEEKNYEVVFDTEPFFSPDGTRAIYFTWSQEKPGLWLVNIDGSDRKNLLEGEFWGGRAVKNYLSWSEDGTLLAVSMDREVFIFDRRGNSISKFEVIKPGEGGEWNEVNYPIISSDKKYLVGQYILEGEKFATPFLVNIADKEIKKFQYPKLENVPVGYSYFFSPQFLSKKGNLLYYLIFFYQEKLTDTPFPPDQFWVLDLNRGENYKIMENALQIIKVP